MITHITQKQEEDFLSFTQKVLRSSYAERWTYLFTKGFERWSKIDVLKGWEGNFSKVRGIEWEKSTESLLLFFKDHKVKRITYFGMGHNVIKVEEHDIDSIAEVLKDNIEGLFVADTRNVFLLTNHNGEKIIYETKD